MDGQTDSYTLSHNLQHSLLHLPTETYPGSTYYVSGIVLDAGDTAVNKTDTFHALMELIV